jgi:hypothetical protein
MTLPLDKIALSVDKVLFPSVKMVLELHKRAMTTDKHAE